MNLDDFDFDACYEYFVKDIQEQDISIMHSVINYACENYGYHHHRGEMQDPNWIKIERAFRTVINSERRPEYQKVFKAYIKRVRSI